MIKTGTDIVEISRFAKMQDIDLFLKHAFTKENVITLAVLKIRARALPEHLPLKRLSQNIWEAVFEASA